jgi:hypothetical protein
MKDVGLFGIFYAHLIYCMAIWYFWSFWYIFSRFGIFFPLSYVIPKKIWQHWMKFDKMTLGYLFFIFDVFGFLATSVHSEM